MKRTLLGIAIGLVIVVAGLAASDFSGQFVSDFGSYVWTGLHTFEAGVTVSAGDLNMTAGDVTIANDERIEFNGSGGDVYVEAITDDAGEGTATDVELWFDYPSTNYVRFDGRVAVGTGAISGDNLLNVRHTFADSAPAPRNGLEANIRFDPNTTETFDQNALNAVIGILNTDGNDATGRISSTLGSLVHLGTGTMSDMAGSRSELTQIGAGTVTDWAGFRSEAFAYGTNITNGYGFYHEGHNADASCDTGAGTCDVGAFGTACTVDADCASVTNEWAFYAAEDLSYFGAGGLIIPMGDIPATCTAGEIQIDTGGATNELCACITTNNWFCSALAAGPAD